MARGSGLQGEWHARQLIGDCKTLALKASNAGFGKIETPCLLIALADAPRRAWQAHQECPGHGIGCGAVAAEWEFRDY